MPRGPRRYFRDVPLSQSQPSSATSSGSCAAADARRVGACSFPAVSIPYCVPSTLVHQNFQPQWKTHSIVPICTFNRCRRSCRSACCTTESVLCGRQAGRQAYASHAAAHLAHALAGVQEEWDAMPPRDPPHRCDVVHSPCSIFRSGGGSHSQDA